MRQITRQQCIDDLRKDLLRAVDDEHSICEVAARRGIFCHGFAQWSLDELRQHYAWSDADFARFHAEICGEPVCVGGDAPASGFR